MKADELTPKQDAFCRAVASSDCKSASDAYRQVYNAQKMSDASVWREAKRLMDNHKVATRIKQLREKADMAVVYTESEHFKKLDELQHIALSLGNVSAALKAEELKGKVKGFYTEKKEVKHEGGLTISWMEADD